MARIAPYGSAFCLRARTNYPGGLFFSAVSPSSQSCSSANALQAASIRLIALERGFVFRTLGKLGAVLGILPEIVRLFHGASPLLHMWGSRRSFTWRETLTLWSWSTRKLSGGSAHAVLCARWIDFVSAGLLAALFNARRFLVAVWIDLSLFSCMLERSRHS